MQTNYCFFVSNTQQWTYYNTVCLPILLFDVSDLGVIVTGCCNRVQPSLRLILGNLATKNKAIQDATGL